MNTIISKNGGEPELDIPDNVDPAAEAAETRDLLHFVHQDNKEAAELFFQFSQAESDDEKERIFDLLKTALTVHADLVEEILYPLVPQVADEADKEEAEELVAACEAGNYIASLILDELSITEIDDDYFKAKMTILSDLVKTQVKREEKEMFEKLSSADLDLEELGEQAVELKGALQENSIKLKNSKKTSQNTSRNSSRSKSATAKGASRSKGTRSSVKSTSGAKNGKSAGKSSSAKSKSSNSKIASGKSGAKSKTTVTSSNSKTKPSSKSKTASKASSGTRGNVGKTKTAKKSR